MGDLAVDDRGSVAFVNEASLDGFVRFYLVRNNVRYFVRAWHGHKRERKMVSVLSGAALICCVKVDDWTNPSTDVPVYRFVLSAEKPAVVSIPPGFVNGSMSLKDETAICYFSDATLDDTRSDDFRYPARLWDPWQVVER
jgi:dTDP-4-dehydrorhamnose 3,5-epimerase-like enzyme